MLGVAAGNLIQGISLDAKRDFLGTTVDLFGWYPCAVGVLAVVTFSLHGVVFLILKSTDEMRARLSQRIWHFWGLFLAVYVLVTIMTLIENPHVAANIRASYWPIPLVVFNVLAVANLPRTILQHRFGQAFVSSAISIICMVGLFFCSIFPWIVISTGPGDSISIHDAASSSGTLWLMLIIALIGIPMVLAYTFVVYWTFRHPIPAE